MTAAPAIILRPPLSDRRDYVHAADLLDALLDATGAEDQAVLRLTRLTANPVALRHDRPPPGAENDCGLFDYRAGGAAVRGWLSLLPGEAIAARDPRLDADAIPDAAFADAAAIATRQPGVSIGKTALVLGVALVERLLPDDVQNLAEMRAAAGALPARRIGVRIDRRISRFLMLSVTADGLPWGGFTLATSPYVEEAP